MQGLLNGCQSFFEILIRPDASGACLQVEEEKVDTDLAPAGEPSIRSVPCLGGHVMSPYVDDRWSFVAHSIKETRDFPKGRKIFKEKIDATMRTANRWIFVASI